MHENSLYRSSLTIWVIMALLCYYAASSTVVLAHANLIESNPAPGARLAAPPDEIRLSFDDQILEGSTFLVFNSDFETVEMGVFVDETTGQELVSTDPIFSQSGVYTLQWLAISSDGHPIEGSFAFSISLESQGDNEMELIALAEEATAFNPPNWVAVVMVLLAIVVPFAVYYGLKDN